MNNIFLLQIIVHKVKNNLIFFKLNILRRKKLQKKNEEHFKRT